MNELVENGVESVAFTLNRILQSGTLPKLKEHFRKHGSLFDEHGVEHIDDYEVFLRSHLRRDDLRIFTYATTKVSGDRMWILVSMDNGAVAMYNETQSKMWSLYLHDEPSRYLASGYDWWIEVTRVDDETKVERWQAPTVR